MGLRMCHEQNKSQQEILAETRCLPVAPLSFLWCRSLETYCLLVPTSLLPCKKLRCSTKGHLDLHHTLMLHLLSIKCHTGCTHTCTTHTYRHMQFLARTEDEDNYKLYLFLFYSLIYCNINRESSLKLLVVPIKP